MKGVVLLLAAGSGDRMGVTEAPKAFLELSGSPLVRRSVEAACAAALVDRIVIAAAPGWEAPLAEVVRGACSKPVRVVTGGPTRQSSAAAALAEAGDAEAVIVHDAARALCPPGLFDECLRSLDQHEAVCVAAPVSDTIKESEGGIILSTLDRSRLVAAQTPQAFRAEVYRRAHEAAERDGVLATDDAALVERIGVPVRVLVRATPTGNIKITTRADLVVAEALLAAEERT